ncbi:MAG: hypothetical protein ACOCRX_10645 [Candidatus Woesearchaeota archaeon]
MKYKSFFLIFLLLFMVFSVICYATEDEYKFPVEVINATGERDSSILSNIFVYEIKEIIRNSNTMRLSSENEPKIIIQIQTLPRFEEDPEISIIYSAVYLFYLNNLTTPYYYDSSLGFCGRDVYKESAKNIVVILDNLIEELKISYQDNIKKGV